MNKPEGAAESHGQTDARSQLQKASYARELRAVGQALEARHVVSLDLEMKGGLYVVRGGSLLPTTRNRRCRPSFKISSLESDPFSPAPRAARSTKSTCLTTCRTSRNLICRAVNTGAMPTSVPTRTV
jgi:hypothetical protein